MEESGGISFGEVCGERGVRRVREEGCVVGEVGGEV